MRNPKDKADKKLYPWHCLETRREDLHKVVALAKGTARFGANFKFSYALFKSVEPFQIHAAGRETCLCRYHLRFEYMAIALYQYRKARAGRL